MYNNHIGHSNSRDWGAQQPERVQCRAACIWGNRLEVSSSWITSVWYGNAGAPDLASKGTQALVGRLAVAATTGALPMPSLGAPTLSPGAEVAAYSARLAALRVALHASADAAMRAACLPESPDKHPSMHATLPLAPPAVARQTHLSPEGGDDWERPAYHTLPYPAAGMEAVLGALVGAWEEVKAAEEARAAEEAAEFRSKTREAAGASEEVRMHLAIAG